MKIAVTGALGKVGSAVVEHLSSQQHTAVSIDRAPVDRASSSAAADCLHVDLTDYADAERALAGCGAVIHLAAINGPDHDAPVGPGVMTPTEINMAVRNPSEPAGGVRALAAIGAAYPDVEFMPPGGIDSDNLTDYPRLPMVSACDGSWVAPLASIANGDFGEIERLAAAAVDIARLARTKP